MEMKQKYIANVINIEKATFTPIVFSMSGGMGSTAMVFYKRIVENVANKSWNNDILLWNLSCYNSISNIEKFEEQ